MDRVSSLPARSYGGVSATERTLERRRRLTDAALDVMVADEWRSATVEQICSSAGLNKRYFYQGFADLDELAAAVVDDIADEVRDATLAAFAKVADQPLERQALASVDALVRVLVRDPRRARVLLGGVAATPSLRRHRDEVLSGLTSVLTRQARVVHGVELDRDPLAQIAPAFVVGGTAEAILAYLDGSARITRDQLVTELTTLWLVTGNGAAEVARARLANQPGSETGSGVRGQHRNG
jgi:AcrR family transcriptional regulator